MNFKIILMTLDREQKLEPKIEGKNQNARTSENRSSMARA